ncbi:MAG: hypothetical protein ABEN55_12220 [Bradymonadaceae bacterium]
MVSYINVLDGSGRRVARIQHRSEDGGPEGKSKIVEAEDEEFQSALERLLNSDFRDPSTHVTGPAPHHYWWAVTVLSEAFRDSDIEIETSDPSPRHPEDGVPDGAIS